MLPMSALTTIKYNIAISYMCIYVLNWSIFDKHMRQKSNDKEILLSTKSIVVKEKKNKFPPLI